MTPLICNLNQANVSQLLKLEEEMYWQGEKWQELWQSRGRNFFKGFVRDYLIGFPKGYFGVIEDDKILGAMFLTKISAPKAIPYLHSFKDYFDPKGTIAYVSFFNVKKGDQEEQIAQSLYEHAENVAMKIGCREIAVVIYHSPLEQRTLEGNNYEKLEGEFEWEIFPGKKVPAHIYKKSLYLERVE